LTACRLPAGAGATPVLARERLLCVAAAVAEATELESVYRFLERLAALEGAQELRDALVLVGAEALLPEVSS
jgi:hypothetical protein